MFSVGLYGPSPTYTVFSHPETDEKSRHWSFPSGLEVALAL